MNSPLQTLNKTLVSSINLSASSSPLGKSTMNASFTSIVLQRFTFDYFAERLNANNYKDVSRRRDELESKREEAMMRWPIVEYARKVTGTRHVLLPFRTLRERLRPHVEILTRQARLRTMKRGQIFMTIESRVGAKKTKSRYVSFIDAPRTLSSDCTDRLMYWQLLDNEKHVQCSESPATIPKENTARESSTTITTSLTRTMSTKIRHCTLAFELDS